MVPRVPAASSEPTAAGNWVWVLIFKCIFRNKPRSKRKRGLITIKNSEERRGRGDERRNSGRRKMRKKREKERL